MAAEHVVVVQRRTIVVAAAHSVTLDTGRASPLFAIDNRHSEQKGSKE